MKLVSDDWTDEHLLRAIADWYSQWPSAMAPGVAARLRRIADEIERNRIAVRDRTEAE